MMCIFRYKGRSDNLLCLGGRVTASPITADLATLKVDDGRSFLRNFDDSVWISHLWHPHEPIAAKYRTNPVFWISGPSRVSATYNGQSCRLIM